MLLEYARFNPDYHALPTFIENAQSRPIFSYISCVVRLHLWVHMFDSSNVTDSGLVNYREPA